MSTVSLTKPGTINVAQIVVCTGVGTDSGDSFQIKVRRWLPTFYTTVVPVMGDADTVPQYEHNGLLYQRGRLEGWMIAGRVPGLAALVDTTKNPVQSGGSEQTLKFFAGSTNTFTFKLIIESIAWVFDREAPFVPLVLTYWGHNTTVSTVEAIT